MTEPTMKSVPNKDYPGRHHSVDAADLATQRAKGWPDFHPEDYCHRCGHPNVSWWIDSAAWNPVMRENPDLMGNWQEIVCIPCFIEVAEYKAGGCTWRVTRDQYGSEVLHLLHAGLPEEAK